MFKLIERLFNPAPRPVPEPEQFNVKQTRLTYHFEDGRFVELHITGRAFVDPLHHCSTIIWDSEHYAQNHMKHSTELGFVKDDRGAFIPMHRVTHVKLHTTDHFVTARD